jgi:hypothetical protein
LQLEWRQRRSSSTTYGTVTLDEPEFHRLSPDMHFSGRQISSMLVWRTPLYEEPEPQPKAYDLAVYVRAAIRSLEQRENSLDQNVAALLLTHYPLEELLAAPEIAELRRTIHQAHDRAREHTRHGSMYTSSALRVLLATCGDRDALAGVIMELSGNYDLVDVAARGFQRNNDPRAYGHLAVALSSQRDSSSRAVMNVIIGDVLERVENGTAILPGDAATQEKLVLLFTKMERERHILGPVWILAGGSLLVLLYSYGMHRFARWFST